LFRQFKINYLFILELDPHYKITHTQNVSGFSNALYYFGPSAFLVKLS
jgi:hypothetical protein